MNDSLPLPAWFLRWLSVDVESLEGGSAAVRFARFPEGEWGLLSLLAVGAIIALFVYLYTKEGAISMVRKLFLASFRALVVVVVAAIVFFPVLEVNRARDLRATTIVMIDDSLSMGLADRFLGKPDYLSSTATALEIDPAAVRDATRAELVNRAVGSRDSALLKALRENNLLQVYTFSDQLRAVTATKSESEPDRSGSASPSGAAASPSSTDAVGPAVLPVPLPPVPNVSVTPRGGRTDLASALRGAIEQQAGTRIAAVVIVTDGRLTAGEGVAGVGEFLREKGIPVHAVGVGDPTPPKNFRVTAVLASERVFAGDPISAEVRVQQKGYEGETVRVTLVDAFAREAGAEVETRELGAVEVTFGDEQTEGSAHFKVELEGLGLHRLTARIEAREEEAFEDDNERTVDVEVVEEASRVLLIAGGPTWEYRFLKNLLRRDRRVTLSAWLISADPDYPQEGNLSLEKLPLEAKELYEYDVVMLLDVDPAGLPPGYAPLLADFVGKHRGGLLFVAGEKYSSAFFLSEAMRPVVEMLPVSPDPTRLRSTAAFHTRIYPLVPTRVASSHAATKLSSQPDRNRMRWNELSGAYWSFPVRKVKPGATVLLRHADPQRQVEGESNPVFAWQHYEGGRVMFLGVDETWRWRSTTADIYDQFWIQSVRYLTESRLLGGRRQLLQTEGDSFDLGDVIRLSGLFLDENYSPVEGESQMLTVEDPEGNQSELRLDRDETSPGWFRGLFVPPGLGEYIVRLPDGSETRLRVEPPDLEFQEPRLDESTLRTLADRTDGSYSRLWEMSTIPAKIPDRRQTVVTADEPIPLWDNWFSMYLLAGLITLEWILRKLHRLL